MSRLTPCSAGAGRMPTSPGRGGGGGAPVPGRDQPPSAWKVASPTPAVSIKVCSCCCASSRSCSALRSSSITSVRGRVHGPLNRRARTRIQRRRSPGGASSALRCVSWPDSGALACSRSRHSDGSSCRLIGICGLSRRHNAANAPLKRSSRPWSSCIRAGRGQRSSHWSISDCIRSARSRAASSVLWSCSSARPNPPAMPSSGCTQACSR